MGALDKYTEEVNKLTSISNKAIISSCMAQSFKYEKDKEAAAKKGRQELANKLEALLAEIKKDIEISTCGGSCGFCTGTC